ncbi:MAG TPA: FIST C-terminal domain-containing protein, partial [Spirochaetales bacterium]|nr:FIST C-terminal domain-containing protein [Spirochaetales bacterium]
MLQVSRRVAIPEDVAALLSDPSLAPSLDAASGILAQLYWNGLGADALEALCAEILRRFPGALLIGASATALISEGSVAAEGAALCLTCFAAAKLRLFRREAAPGSEEEAGAALAADLASCPELKAALLLLSPEDVDSAALLRGLRSRGGPPLLFGGGAARLAEGESGVLGGGPLSERAVVAVALCGEELAVEAACIFDWRPLGPALDLTMTERNRVGLIDGRPAFEHYRENLGIADREDLRLLEFPLLVERGGETVARNPVSVGPDGSVALGAEIRRGEAARLGFLDLKAQAESVERALGKLRGFGPQAILLYSCVCRLYTLQSAIESETAPFQALAPAAGFFTSGEVCGADWLLNSSEVAVGLREGPPSPGGGAAGPPPSRSGGGRHERTTSQLLSFIASLTERLEAANAALSLRNEELAASNEGLCEEVAERKLSEERERRVSEERMVLLRELQHRVKNNLALISSIARIEASLSPSPEARLALGKLEARIAALASLYDVLFHSGEIREIGLAGYIGGVVDLAASGLGADAKGIEVAHRVDDLRLDVKRAIPIGLVVNELVTDAVKYAFPGGRRGRIEVSLAQEGEALVLAVRDDGAGMPPGQGGQ